MSANAIRISCLGDSITAGCGNSTTLETSEKTGHSYPCRLQYYLDERTGEGTYQVFNFGRGCAAATQIVELCDTPYIFQEQYRKAKAQDADIVLMMFGANDAHGYDAHGEIVAEEFVKGYKSLIEEFRNLPSHPRIIILIPIIAKREKITRAYDKRILSEIWKIVDEEHLEYIDLQKFTKEHDWQIDVDHTLEHEFTDELHPNDKGYDILANEIANYILK